MEKGIIFNIQKHSIHDGPGIRTTVFLKGCHLKCWWCHNPESINPKKEMIFWKDRCINCGDCQNACDVNGVEQNVHNHENDNKQCILCGKCVEVCPTEAREIIGKSMTIHEVLEEIEKDSVFYDETGGGVTFSGGEPLLQHEFLYDILRKCKEKGIHTAIDTSGYVTWDVFEKIVDYVDLFLYDIKHFDKNLHRKYTGVSNGLILENLEKLSTVHNNIIIRVPIIPSINDDKKNILKIGEFIQSLNLHDVNILPYHNTGMDKYERLNKGYKLSFLECPSKESMIKIKDLLDRFALSVKIGG